VQSLTYYFFRFPCPPQYQNFCRSELEIFQRVMGEGRTVERAEHVLAGARRCAYELCVSPASACAVRRRVYVPRQCPLRGRFTCTRFGRRPGWVRAESLSPWVARLGIDALDGRHKAIYQTDLVAPEPSRIRTLHAPAIRHGRGRDVSFGHFRFEL
jgi:hypothetical protein